MKFWRTMRYGCDGRVPSVPDAPKGCGDFEIEVYLEDGCEGPRDGIDVKVHLPKTHPFRPGEKISIPCTSTGRFVVPVPFVAGQCPKCAHGLSHVRWNEDRVLDPVLVVEVADGPHFRYPTDASSDSFDACGIPTGFPTRAEATS